MFPGRILNFDVQRQAAKFPRGGEARPVFRDAGINPQAFRFGPDAKQIIGGGEMRPRRRSGKPRHTGASEFFRELRVCALAMDIRFDLADVGTVVLRGGQE